MIDLLFTFESNASDLLAAALGRFRTEPGTRVLKWSGRWGSLACTGSAYPGFDPVETRRHIAVVLGGPLPRRDRSVASGEACDDGTRWILRNGVESREIAWDDDLVGSFLVAVVDKQAGEVMVVTDIDSFVPAYSTDGNQGVPTVVGSHADAVALAAGVQEDLDLVSIGDFLSYGTVTYPCTMYERVTQLPPASIIRFGGTGRPQVEEYWTLGEESRQFSLEDLARQLRETVIANVERMCVGQKEVSLFMSGGEDSRAVASVVPVGTRVRAVTFLDSLNREGRIAERVARRLGLDWKAVMRSPTIYLDHACQSMLLCESHGFFQQAHFKGLERNVSAGMRVLGAVLSDTLCKSHYAHGRLTEAGIKFGVSRNQWQYQYSASIARRLPSSLVQQVRARRSIRNAQLRRCRPFTWAEWHSLAPASMRMDITYSIANRRLFFMFEPFMDSRIFKLSAITPQSWKLNGRLFHRAMRPVFRKTWDIPHGNGTMPYFGLWVNAPLRLLGTARAMMALVSRKAGFPSKLIRNEGPWSDFHAMVQTPEFLRMAAECNRVMEQLSADDSLAWLRDVLRFDDRLTALERFRVLHVLLWVSAVWRKTDNRA